jgi:protein O-GlcNAc transferase
MIQKSIISVCKKKPAQIQVTWLGYPNTTGLSAIDYRFTDIIADPIGKSDQLHSEKLIRLNSGFQCYKGNESLPKKNKIQIIKKDISHLVVSIIYRKLHLKL